MHQNLCIGYRLQHRTHFKSFTFPTSYIRTSPARMLCVCSGWIVFTLQRQRQRQYWFWFNCKCVVIIVIREAFVYDFSLYTLLVLALQSSPLLCTCMYALHWWLLCYWLLDFMTHCIMFSVFVFVYLVLYIYLICGLCSVQLFVHRFSFV
jgi:hypothetical protein